VGRFVFRLPDIGEGVTEAEIAEWHVAVGDHVAEDAPLVDVLTDKATVDMTSPVRGVVVALHGEVGAARAVGSPLVELEVEGHAEAETAPAAPEPAAAPAKPSETAEPTPAKSEGGQVLAAPAVRARAKAMGLDLAAVKGSGPEGRITHADLDAQARPAQAAVAQTTPGRSGPHPAAAHAGGEGVTAVKIIGLRRKIAEQMAVSRRSIAHLGYVEEVDVTALEALRERYNAKAAQRLSVLPFIALAMVRSLPEFPQINAVYDDEAGVLYQSAQVHLGVATQTVSGLMVPVVRDAARLTIRGMAQAIASAAAAARDGSAKREDLSGSTITISSLGALAGISASPVINHPEVAIVAPNRVREHLALKDGQVVVRKVMNLSTAFDHRIVDGHDAASFVARVKALLETPELLLLG
jgi:2-oxoisovalerate dehydrogenase E2 component (dihydrolipoyl transacylase)